MGDVFTVGVNLMAFSSGSTFAALEQHTQRQVTVGGSVQERLFAGCVVHLVHRNGHLASSVGRINYFHIFGFGLH
jgi:hypothetical protein